MQLIPEAMQMAPSSAPPAPSAPSVPINVTTIMEALRDVNARCAKLEGEYNQLKADYDKSLEKITVLEGTVKVLETKLSTEVPPSTFGAVTTVSIVPSPPSQELPAEAV